MMVTVFDATTAGMGPATALNLALELQGHGRKPSVLNTDPTRSMEGSSHRLAPKGHTEIPILASTGDLRLVVGRIREHDDDLILNVPHADSLEMRTGLLKSDVLLVLAKTDSAESGALKAVTEAILRVWDFNPLLAPVAVLHYGTPPEQAHMAEGAKRRLARNNCFQVAEAVLFNSPGWFHDDTGRRYTYVSEAESREAIRQLTSELLAIPTLSTQTETQPESDAGDEGARQRGVHGLVPRTVDDQGTSVEPAPNLQSPQPRLLPAGRHSMSKREATVPLGVSVRPEVDALASHHAACKGITKRAFVEQAILAYLS